MNSSINNGMPTIDIAEGMEMKRYLSRPAILRRFRRDRSGIAAVEFALMLPVLLVLYFGAMEIGQAIETNKKVSRIAALVGDLVSQNSELSASDVDAIMKIGAATIMPYNRGTADIKITGVNMSNDAVPVATVAWKRNLVGTTYSGSGAAATTVDVPTSLRVKGAFLVKVEADLDYNLVLTWNGTSAGYAGIAGFFNGIPMKETYYLRPRMSEKIVCKSNCS